jgi:hypothetical protein
MAAETCTTRPAAVRARPLVVAAVSAALLVSACSSSNEASSAPSPSAAGSSATASPSPSTGSPSPTTSSASPSPSRVDRTATPARTSGTLGPTSMPLAAALGPRWTSRVDPGSAEDGYTGNGTSVVARDPRDVADALLPLGCGSEAVYATPMPVPKHALEADYAYKPTGAHAIGLVLEYADAATASRMVRLYTAALRRCRAGGGGTMVVTVEPTAGSGLFASRQVDTVAQETWRELVAPAGRVVRLIAVEGATTPVRPWSAIAADLPAPA